MKNLVIAWLAALVGCSYAQTPDWQVDASKYNYTMVLVGLIKVSGAETSSPKDKVAAFINGEVRGVATPVLQQQVNRNIFYLIIYHNDSGGNITFKYYNAEKNTVTTSAQTATFIVDGLVGDAYKPFVWSDRVTNKSAEILSYSFPDQYGSRIYPDSVLVRVDETRDVSSIAPSFTLSDGASLFINNERQTSGTGRINFANPVVLTVRSEDEQTVRKYEVHVRRSKDEIPNVLFPNGNVANKTWGVAHLGIIEQVKINVFDQNGHVLFNTSNPDTEWDGRYQGELVPEGIYFYSIEREDGSKRQGTVHIVY